MKRKPTPAQIAARERFAEMARSGAFKKKASKAKAKPKQSSGEKRLASLKLSQYKIYNDIIERVQSGQSVKSAYDAVLGKGAYERLAGELYDEARKTKTNPRASNPIILVSDKAIASKRKANPVKPKTPKYTVQTLTSGKANWKRVAMFDSLEQAKAYAQAVPRAYKVVAVRVIDDK